MCGRFTFVTDQETLTETFPEFKFSGYHYAPRYNIAPSQPIPVVANTGDCKVEYFHWGLIPHWAKDHKISSKMINARSETLAEKPSFRVAYQRQRCLVLTDGFYEWRRNEDGSKSPMYIQTISRAPFAFAGLWESWDPPKGNPIRSCTIITTNANTFMSQIHHRMPVILDTKDFGQWLTPEEKNSDQLQGLLKPYESETLVGYKVSSYVNSPRNDSSDCILPI
ncbi:hypothetical protein CMK22_09255 [Candidatus Poribacteria bacterium]|nr:hypothetical protein [Candidatus Poribacteria bacterium]